MADAGGKEAFAPDAMEQRNAKIIRFAATL